MLEATVALFPQGAVLWLSSIWIMEEVSSSLGKRSNTAQENKEATPAVDTHTYKSDPLCSIRAKIQSNWILEKYGLTISISEGSKTNLDSSRWTKFTVSRTAPTVASSTQQSNSEIQMSSHEQDNAFISLTPRAGWESWVSAATKNRLWALLWTCKHQTTLRGGQGKWMAVTVLRVTQEMRHDRQRYSPVCPSGIAGRSRV